MAPLPSITLCFLLDPFSPIRSPWQVKGVTMSVGATLGCSDKPVQRVPDLFAFVKTFSGLVLDLHFLSASLQLLQAFRSGTCRVCVGRTLTFSPCVGPAPVTSQSPVPCKLCILDRGAGSVQGAPPATLLSERE